MRSRRAWFCDASTRIPATIHELLESALGLLDECLVADAEPLVHQEDLGLETGAHRESESQAHTRRVRVYRHRQVVTELRECRHLVHALTHLFGV